MNKRKWGAFAFALAWVGLALSACATNPGVDKRIVCSLDGKALYLSTFGPFTFAEKMPDADKVCEVATTFPKIGLTK